MFQSRYWLAALVCLFASLVTLPAQAGQYIFGNYIVHYNALNTDTLAPEVARQYQIKRSKNRGMFNISVQKRVPGQLGQAVTAKIAGQAINLNAQTKQMQPREIKEGPAIYYIGEFPVSDRETMDFTFDITPQGEQQPFTLHFRQTFYVH
ncbi:MAG: DUF4426 domain-containing protein [Proteobacteria bacterium]|jgi:hypothetical protein|nr:DUF4426 domain-containing protein [Pseudomonadota bacterium]MCG6934663.1 DUF4426 domain-containing protein [Pseudomonadota bacterium]